MRNQWGLILIPMLVVFSGFCQLKANAAGDDNTTASGVSSDNNNNVSPNTFNQGVLSYPAFSSSSSFSGYSSYGSQCGFSISAGYLGNGSSSNVFQITSTFNTNPCVNQSELEKLKQESESEREIIRANAQIITTCINARSEAVQKGLDPNIICTLQQFEIPRNFREH